MIKVIKINGQEYKLVPLGFCACGCGAKTTISPVTDRRRGYKGGVPRKYKAGHNYPSLGLKREQHPGWKGGRNKDNAGYNRLYMPEHPKASSNGYVREHIYLAEKALGKSLPDGSQVHHHNSNQLVICQDISYHKLLHQRMRSYRACGHANWRRCMFCRQYDDPSRLYVGPNRHPIMHRSCRNERIRLKKSLSYL